MDVVAAADAGPRLPALRGRVALEDPFAGAARTFGMFAVGGVAGTPQVLQAGIIVRKLRKKLSDGVVRCGRLSPYRSMSICWRHVVKLLDKCIFVKVIDTRYLLSVTRCALPCGSASPDQDREGDHNMASAHDVAAYILKNQGSMTTWKLQKLVYYSQAWSLVWDEAALFPEPIEAWANGPVVKALYDHHRGEYSRSTWPLGKLGNLTQKQKETINAVLNFYGDKSGQWLSDLTHMEDPWRNARAGMPSNRRSNKRITIGAMSDYYSGLQST